jgi:sortase A
MKKNKRANLLLSAGGALVLAAALLTGYNLYSEQRGDAQASQTAEALQQLIPAQAQSASVQSASSDSTVAEQMQTVTIDGEDYIGTLEIPSLSISLPVNANWSYPRLKKSPCRYQGSFLSGDLIIAGHNYRHGFGKLRQLQEGDAVTFTDVDGYVYSYAVSEIDLLDGKDTAGMAAGDWDLTLFTCTVGGAKRVTVRCQKMS